MKNVFFLIALSCLLTACFDTAPSTDTPDTTPEPVAAVTPCEESPANPMEVEWMASLVNKHQIEQVIRYDLNEKAVYFFKIIRCCDHQSFLVDCLGKEICIDGGITGGTCKERMASLQNEKILWEAPKEDAAAKEGTKAETTSQPNQ